MTTWLERYEKILQHNQSITLRHALPHQSSTDHQIPKLQPRRHVTMAKEPSQHSVSLDSIVNDYGATYIRDALARFIVQTNSPYLTRAQVEQRSLYTFLPFLALPVFHRVKFCDENDVIIDAIHAQPARKDKQGRLIPARFDTALVDSSNSDARLNSSKKIHGMYYFQSQDLSLIAFSRLSRCSNTRRVLVKAKSPQATLPPAY